MCRFLVTCWSLEFVCCWLACGHQESCLAQKTWSLASCGVLGEGHRLAHGRRAGQYGEGGCCWSSDIFALGGLVALHACLEWYLPKGLRSTNRAIDRRKPFVEELSNCHFDLLSCSHVFGLKPRNHLSFEFHPSAIPTDQKRAAPSS